jgi:hypothetical protein
VGAAAHLLADERGGHGGSAGGDAAAGVPRLVHVSSVVVVGRVVPGRVVDEEHPCQPLDPYQRTKLEAERLALAYARYRGCGSRRRAAGRPLWAVGEYAFNRLFFVEPLRGWRIQVNGGRHITFPAYTGDVAAGIIAALEKGRSGDIYNLSGESHSPTTKSTTSSATSPASAAGAQCADAGGCPGAGARLDGALPLHAPRAVLPYQPGPLRLPGLAGLQRQSAR